MADSETTQVDTHEQVTSKIPTTQPAKNPKMVAVAERTKQSREAQKKAAEAAIAAGIVSPEDAGPVHPSKNQPRVHETPKEDGVETRKEDTKNVTNTTQWISIISIVVALMGI